MTTPDQLSTIRTTIRRLLPGTDDPVLRAAVLAEAYYAAIDNYKAGRGEGEGLDGMDGPERSELSRLGTLIVNYNEAVRRSTTRSADEPRPVGTSQVLELLDQLVDSAKRARPDLEWGITIAKEQAAHVPVHADRVWRTVNAKKGTYTGHTYRDCLVDTVELKPWFMFVTAVDDAAAPTYYGDLRTGSISTQPPPDAYFHH